MRKLAVFLFVLFSLPLWAQEQDTLKRYSLSLEEAKRQLAAPAVDFPEVRYFLEFLDRSKRGIIR